MRSGISVRAEEILDGDVDCVVCVPKGVVQSKDSLCLFAVFHGTGVREIQLRY